METLEVKEVFKQIQIFFPKFYTPSLTTNKTGKFLIYTTAYNDPYLLSLTLTSLYAGIRHEKTLPSSLEYEFIIFDNSTTSAHKDANRKICESIAEKINLVYIDSAKVLPDVFYPGGRPNYFDNWGHRGSLNYLKLSGISNNYEYILLYDQDQLLNMPLNYFKKGLDSNPHLLTVSGYRKADLLPEDMYRSKNNKLIVSNGEHEGGICLRGKDFNDIFPMPMFDFIHPKFAGDCDYGSSPPIGMGF
jgi:hypothetical protein